MGADSPLATNGDGLVDANIFYALGHPPNARYDRFRREVQRVGVVPKLPRRGVGELGGPENARVRIAIEAGGRRSSRRLTRQMGDAVAASDIVRRTIANETDRAEYEVGKTDTILTGLVIQYRDRAPTTVVVLTDDQPARPGIENAVTAQGYTDSITVYGLADIIGDDPGDSPRLI